MGDGATGDEESRDEATASPQVKESVLWDGEKGMAAKAFKEIESLGLSHQHEWQKEGTEI